MAAVPVTRPTTQDELTALAAALDEGFGMVPPATMLRVGFMFDLLRTDQCLLLAGTVDDPLGGAVALRADGYLEGVAMAVVPRAQGAGVGRAMAAELVAFAVDRGISTVRWSVSPRNLQGVGAYLSYGARITGWVDDAYGVASYAFYAAGSTDRFRGEWRQGGFGGEAPTMQVGCDDYTGLRELLLAGGQVVALAGDHYDVVPAPV